jgi:excisionase family DNA binding protein
MSPRKTKKRVSRGPILSSLSPGAESNVMTLHDVADYLHCHYSTAIRLATAGEIPSFKLGGNWRFLKSDIDEWIAKGGGSGPKAREQKPAAKKPRRGER